MEHWRRQWPHCGGTLIWQLNDCWPVHSWALVDYARRPKASWYYARRFFAPVLLSLVAEGDQILAYVVNERAADLTSRLIIRAWHSDGRELWRHEGEVGIGGASAGLVARVSLPAAVTDTPNAVVIAAELAGAGVDNVLTLAEPKEMALADPILRFTAADEDEGITIALTVERPALGVELSLPGEDADWSDNYLAMLPGRTYRVRVRPARPLRAADVAAALRWRHLAGVGSKP